jgi:molybdopterin-guanine dinucleotide biosynthesis protein A
MGLDKALLTLNGQTLLQRAVDLARSVTPNVFVVGPKEKFGTDAIEDVFAGQGPLAGIHAALLASQTDYNLVLSVDTPFVAAGFLRFLVDEAARCETVVTVPFLADGYQPLCAVYRREFLEFAEAALRAGRNKIDPLFCHTTVRRIDEAEIIGLAFAPRMFDNLNTPEDFAQAQNRR